jgi:hypothetical protein
MDREWMPPVRPEEGNTAPLMNDPNAPPRSHLEYQIELLVRMIKNRDAEIERLRCYVKEWENDARERHGIPRQT